MRGLSPSLKHLVASHARPALEVAASLARWSGASRRGFRRAPPGGFRVLTYHQTPRKEARAFRRQMEWLCSNRRVVALGELVEMLPQGKSPPKGAVAVTFDDGFADNFDVAVPILRELALPACFFIATDFIDLAGRGRAALDAWGERVYRFTRAAPPMSWDDVRRLGALGFEIGLHTKTHADLAKLSHEQVGSECRESLERLSRELGARPTLFAYPYGKSAMAPAAVRRLAMAAGDFRAAFSTERGWNAASTPREWLHRDSMEPRFSPRLLEAFLSGLFDS